MEKSLRYRCENQVRANALRAMALPPVNGIDYLEVLDEDARPGPLGEDLRQRTLLLHLFSGNDIPTDLEGLIDILGGVRIHVQVDWAFLAADADTQTVGAISAEELAFYSALPDADRVLVVRTDSDGDFSPYRLRLHAPGDPDAPLAGFDPVLFEVEFSFKVECPSDFDCRPAHECPDDVPPTPAIDYLAKDYLSFRQLMLDRMAVTNPEWKERHVPDLQLSLVELLAYAADRLSYFQDAVATEAYLNTARRRTSVRRHARLLNYPMHDGCNARTWVHLGVRASIDFKVDPDSPADGHPEFGVIANPVRFLPEMPGWGTLITPLEFDRLIGEHPSTIVFEQRTRAKLRPLNNGIHFHTWGAEECCLPKGATWADLVDNGFDLAAGDFLLIEEVLGTGSDVQPDPTRRQVVRLVAVDALPEPDPVYGTPVRRVHWHAQDALQFPICLSYKREADNTVVPDVSRARGNMLLTDHGRSLPREPLTARNPDSLLPYRPSLNERGPTFWQPPNGTGTITGDMDLSARSLLEQDPRAALPAIELEGDDKFWTPRRDLLGSDRFDTHFVAETESDGIVRLRFGDDIYGLEPAEDAFVNDAADPEQHGADYRIGNGTAGNLGAGALMHISGAGLDGIDRVYQPLPAAGGTAPETLEEVRQYAPEAFRIQKRAVTTDDYSARTEEFPSAKYPDVQHAATTRRWTGSWYTMFVTADRREGKTVDAPFEEPLTDHLEGYRMTGHDVEVDAPRFVPLDIRMSVCVEDGHFPHQVKQQLVQVFGTSVLADGRKGFFHPDNFTFGQPVYLSQVVAAAMAVDGVKWVDLLPSTAYDHRFQRWGKEPNNEIADGYIPIERLEIAQLDNDPSRPENGSIMFHMH